MVPVFRKQNILLVRTPGCGSSSFKMNLQRMENPDWLICQKYYPCFKWSKVNHRAHLTARQLREIFPDEWDSFRTIGMIRHPVDWTNSIYRKNGIMEALSEDTSGSYTDYLKRLELTPYHWFSDLDGSIMVDELYRTEDYESIVYPSLGIPPPYPRDTVSKKPKITPTDEDMEILRIKFRKEYTHYDKLQT